MNHWLMHVDPAMISELENERIISQTIKNDWKLSIRQEKLTNPYREQRVPSALYSVQLQSYLVFILHFNGKVGPHFSGAGALHWSMSTRDRATGTLHKNYLSGNASQFSRLH
jgi:hypothetical protein